MRTKKIVFAMSLAVLAAGAAQAKEGGDQYPNGAENWLAGAVPPPGDTSSTISVTTAASCATATATR